MYRQSENEVDDVAEEVFLLLQKTLLNIEGLGRQLYPDLDLWKTAKPFLERWMSEQIGPRAVWRELSQHVPRWSENLPALPNLIVDVLKQVNAGQAESTPTLQEIRQLRQQLHRAHRRNVLAIVGAAFVLGAAVLLGLDGLMMPMVWGMPIGSWVMGAGGLVLLAMAWPDSDGPD